MAVLKLLDGLAHDIEQDARQAHAPAQAARFVALFVAALATQAASGVPLFGRADLWSLIAGAAGVAWGQWRKTVPLPAVLKAVADAKASAGGAPEPPPKTAS